jgi:ech hydrogenase subunit D
MASVQIEPHELLPYVKTLRDAGWRLVQISASNPKHFEFNYTFDLRYELVNLKISTPERIKLTSITDFFPAAFLYENEISELFGVTIEGMNIDYKGNLYGSKKVAPFCKVPTAGEEI